MARVLGKKYEKYEEADELVAIADDGVYDSLEVAGLLSRPECMMVRQWQCLPGGTELRVTEAHNSPAELCEGQRDWLYLRISCFYSVRH